MPTDQPNNAPDAVTPRDDTATKVLRDDAQDIRPGGGGLGPQSAPPGTVTHGTGPNAPINTGLPEEDVGTEARRRATDPS
jgi:hypothetical protein